MTDKLTGDALARETAPLTDTGWTLEDGDAALTKTFEFKNFVEAFGWMTQAAIHAEKMDHHPEWSNVYNRVEVVLTTHDADGVTTHDLELAGFMDAMAAKFR